MEVYLVSEESTTNVNEQIRRQDAAFDHHFEVFKHMTTLDTALAAVVFAASGSERFTLNVQWIAAGLVGIAISLLFSLLGMVMVTRMRERTNPDIDVRKRLQVPLFLCLIPFILVVYGGLTFAAIRALGYRTLGG